MARNGYGGGLAILWDSCVSLNIRNFLQHHIDADVIQQNGIQWRITGFYGYPEVALHYRSWDLLRSLHNGYSDP